MDYRHAGVHWPNGAADNELLRALPGPSLMLASEARYHYNTVRGADRLVVWRALPRVGKRPAELRYNPSKAADECLNLWNEQPHRGVEHFQPFCELNLNYERGDTEDDHSNLDERMGVLVQFLTKIEPELRSRLPAGTRLHFPPWVPDGRAYDRVQQWRDVANRYDVINIHQYGNAPDLVDWVRQHLEMFPDKDVFLSEWWPPDNGYDECLRQLRKLAGEEPRFIGATCFIGRWYNAPDWWEKRRNVQDNPLLYNIFKVAELVPEYQMPEPSVEEYKAYAHSRMERAGFDWPSYEKMIEQESHWRHLDSNGNVKTSYSGVAKGIGQLNKNFYPEDVWRNPWKNLDMSIDIIIDYLKRFGTYRKAFAAYNWGPSNVSGYTDSQGRVHPAWDGTPEWRCPINLPQCQTAQRDHYLDVILGPGWPEPGAVTPLPEEPVADYVVGPGIANKMAEHSDTPATDEHAGGFDANGQPQWAMAFGKSGAMYVYLHETNENHRFPPD